jgi:hypothetical protein
MKNLKMYMQYSDTTTHYKLLQQNRYLILEKTAAQSGMAMQPVARAAQS